MAKCPSQYRCTVAPLAVRPQQLTLHITLMHLPFFSEVLKSLYFTPNSIDKIADNKVNEFSELHVISSRNNTHYRPIIAVFLNNRAND
jgi:hypothetical protein